MYKILYNIGMKVGVYCNRSAKKFIPIQKTLFAGLEKNHIAYEVYDRPEEIGNIDVLVVLGGDGTILRVALEAGRRGIRLLGINAGNLGFLTEFEGEQTEEAVTLLCEDFAVQRRSVLEIEVSGQKMYALNDSVFQRRYDERSENNVVSITAEIDGNKVDEFVGDGIIVSTPTGSTAYSLSAGGSILTPDIEAFILTPICAHSLHNRPIVYADSSELRVFLSGKGAKLSLCLDGQFARSICDSDSVILRKAPFFVEFIKRKNSNFFSKLLFKLNKWSN